METTNTERLDHDAAARNCDECGCLIECGEQANPSGMAEAFCRICWPTVEAEMAAVPSAICECCDERPATTTETAVIWTLAFTKKPGSVESTPMCGPCAAAVVGQIRPWMATLADELTGCVAHAWPVPVDAGQTKRLAVPSESMSSLVFGGAL